MRNIFISLMLIFATSLMANEIKWAKDFESGIASAMKENKPVLFVFSRHTCKYCVILEKTTLSNETVIKKLNKNFISIVAYSDDNDAMPKELWRPGTPTIWFLKPNGEPMFQPLMGAVDAKNFIKVLDIVKKEFDKPKKRVK